MPIFERYIDVLKGTVILTGNSMMLYRPPGEPRLAGPFTTVDTTQQAGTSPPGTTLDWRLNSAMANLRLPPGVTVERAELTWTGLYLNSQAADAETPITFTTPLTTVDVVYQQEVTQPFPGVGGIFYTRTADVTGLVRAGGSGDYIVGRVIGTNGYEVRANATGWYLSVAVSGENYPYRLIQFNIGQEQIPILGTLDFSISDFITPATGNVTGKLFMGTNRGDGRSVDNVTVFVGPDTSSLNTQLTRPPLPPNGLMFGIISDTQTGDIIDTTGTFGNNNNDPFTSTTNADARFHLDIATFDISPSLNNSQSTFTTRSISNGANATFVYNVYALQIDVQSADLPTTKLVDKTEAEPGDYLTYTIIFTNIGEVSANDVFIRDIIPDGTTFVEGSIESTEEFIGDDITEGITLVDPVLPEGVVSITFRVRVDKGIPIVNPKVNDVTITYNFIPGPGLDTIDGDNTSNEVETLILTGLDFGDAPDTSAGNGTDDYSTLLANNGPRHVLYNNLRLGQNITAETDAYQNADATGDDLGLGVQDDGAKTPISLIVSGDDKFKVQVSYINDSFDAARIYGWIDFNRDGIFQIEEANEVLSVVPSNVNPRNAELVFNIPQGTSFNPGDMTFMRLRITTDSLASANVLGTDEDTRSLGLANDGEVEDYILTITELNIVGTVWYDLNCNGIREIGEPLAEGITVQLFDLNDDSLPIATRTTDSLGEYSFLDIPSGKYYIKVILKDGYSFTIPNVGGDNLDSDVNSDGISSILDMNFNNILETVDGGLCKCNTISGIVFYDCDNDGIYDDGEPGLCGVLVKLIDDDMNMEIKSVFTDCDGYYEFSCVKAGDYTVMFIAPEEMTITTEMSSEYYGSKPDSTNLEYNLTLTNSDYREGFAGFTGSLALSSKYCVDCKKVNPFSCNANACLCQNCGSQSCGNNVSCKCNDVNECSSCKCNSGKCINCSCKCVGCKTRRSNREWQWNRESCSKCDGDCNCNNDCNCNK